MKTKSRKRPATKKTRQDAAILVDDYLLDVFENMIVFEAESIAHELGFKKNGKPNYAGAIEVAEGVVRILRILSEHRS